MFLFLRYKHIACPLIFNLIISLSQSLSVSQFHSLSFYQTTYSDMDRWHSRSSSWCEVTLTAWLWDWSLCNMVRYLHTHRKVPNSIISCHWSGTSAIFCTLSIYLFLGRCIWCTFVSFWNKFLKVVNKFQSSTLNRYKWFLIIPPQLQRKVWFGSFISENAWFWCSHIL